jgi:hypothetical protein
MGALGGKVAIVTGGAQGHRSQLVFGAARSRDSPGPLATAGGAGGNSMWAHARRRMEGALEACFPPRRLGAPMARTRRTRLKRNAPIAWTCMAPSSPLLFEMWQLRRAANQEPLRRTALVKRRSVS